MSRKPNISVAPVTAFIGYPRSGKTYHMTMIALELLAAGEKVASRHEIKGALPITSDLEMVHLSGFHVFLDEWHIDRPAEEWRSLGMKMRNVRRVVCPILRNISREKFRRFVCQFHLSACGWSDLEPSRAHRRSSLLPAQKLHALSCTPGLFFCV